MAFVLTTASKVVCGHGASAAVASSAKLTVGGNEVLLLGEEKNWPFDAACSQKKTDSGEVQCAAIVSVSGGASTKLSVGGQPVLTDDLAGLTSGALKNTDLSAQAKQSKLEVSG